MRKLAIIAAALAASFAASSATAVNHPGKQVIDIYMNGADQCFHFRLGGVDVSDPAAGHAWFGVPKTHPNFAEIFSFLFTAYTQGTVVNVGTTGGIECGEAAISYVGMNK